MLLGVRANRQQAHGRASCRASREPLIAALFLAPSVLLLGLFAYFPLLASAYLSLTRWDIVAPAPTFVGLRNYEQLFADPRFPLVLRNTAVYATVVVGISTVLGLGLALLLNRRLAGYRLYRTAIFTPYVTSYAAVAMIWLWIFDPRLGLMNHLLRALLLPAPDWLASPDWAMPALIIMTVWHTTGYTMVIFLAGLQNVPSDLHEAAQIDGASPPSIFWHITLPLLSPTSFFLIATGLVTAVQMFDAVAVMTRGGPVDSTNVLVFYLYQRGFQFFELGYASAIAMVVFALMLALTAFQLSTARRWVHYG